MLHIGLLISLWFFCALLQKWGSDHLAVVCELAFAKTDESSESSAFAKNDESSESSAFAKTDESSESSELP